MARNTTVMVPAGTWTQLTANDVSEISFQNQGGYPVWIKATEGAVVPADRSGAWMYRSGLGELAVSLAELAPALSATRVYVWAHKRTKVAVSHA